MIKNERLKRITSHLERYKNTIIVPDDFKKDKLENLVKAIEDKGFVVKSLVPGRVGSKSKDEIKHWIIEVR